MKPESLTAGQLIEQLQALADPASAAGMARFGIHSASTLGVSMPKIRQLARGRRSQQLSLDLWTSGIHEARILAALVGEPDKVTPGQMDAWVLGFDSWDVCDQACMNLFDRTAWAYEKAVEYAGRQEEFVKRAGFALMASLAVHDKHAPDAKFLAFLPVIQHEAADGRNFVKKAVNWALRQIGKRNLALRAAAMETARAILALDAPAARWVAHDALRELESHPLKR